MRRRQFLCRTGMAAAGLALAGAGNAARAVAPPDRRGPARFRLSLAAYSFRNQFVDRSHAPDADPGPRRMTLPEFIAFCAEQGCDGAELTSYYFPREVTPEFLRQLKRQAFLSGVAISGTAVGNTFTLPPGEKRDREIAQVKQWIDHAAVLGAPHIRVFAGDAAADARAAAVRRCVEALEECAEYAGRHAIFLGLENHGGIVSGPDELLEVVRAVQSPWVGVNLDTGNFHTADPYAALAQCAPYAVNVQLKADIRPSDARAQPADLSRLVRLLRDAGYQGFVAIEYESAEDPFVAVPRLIQELKPLLAG